MILDNGSASMILDNYEYVETNYGFQANKAIQ